MNETKEIRFKSTFFSKEKRIVLDQEYIEFYKSINVTNPVKFSKFEIDGFRFGIKWLRGYRLIFGRIYCIDIKSATEDIIKIRMTSVYKIRLKKLHEKYSSLINIILEYYVSNMVNQYLKTFTYKQPFSILNIHINQAGIILNDKNFIEWNNLDIKTHTRYVAISTKNPSEIYKAFDYIEEWNTLVLYNVIRLILKNKSLLRD